MASRQYNWQVKMMMQGQGRCLICGKDRNGYKQYCDSCAERRRERERKYGERYRREVLGFKPCRPGGKGRPPREFAKS